MIKFGKENEKMKKITKLIALVLALALVLSLTACAGKASIVGTWKYNLDFQKLMEASGELSAEGNEDNKELADAMIKLFEGLNMVLVLDLKEDKSFTLSTDEASLKAAAEKMKERIPDRLKTMFGGEEGLNAMLETSGQTMDDITESFAEQFSVDDMKLEATKGTYTYEEGKLVLTSEDGETETMTVELSAKELKVTGIEGQEEDDMAEALKSVLPMVFTK